ncbi:MAG: hypothetical protein ACRDHK_11190 [Actinomycetota bacterium]
MSAHFGAVEADLFSHYGVDLREALWGSGALGVRRLAALLRGLPRGGAVHRALDPQGWDWSHGDEILAHLSGLGPRVDTRRRQSTVAEQRRVFGNNVKVVR